MLIRRNMASKINMRLRKQLQGYSGGRPDVLKIISGTPKRVLDIGCGAGLLGRQIQEQHPNCLTHGVEPDKDRAAVAREHYHEVFQGSIEDSNVLALLADKAPFDLIICADVLEHLIDPPTTLKILTTMLSSDGQIITSLPNVRHVSTFVDLYLRGTWPQRDRGIHDRTHLHFYARANILQLGSGAGLSLIQEKRNLRIFESQPWSMIPALALDFWPIRGLFTFQYIHRWRKPNG